jgi:hypothetical protein
MKKTIHILAEDRDEEKDVKKKRKEKRNVWWGEKKVILNKIVKVKNIILII